jgi:3-dehydroquinate synthase
VDTAAGKNLVGAFHRPAAVVADPEVLTTLPIAQRRAGVAEAIKHGVIADGAYFEQTLAALPALLDEPGGDAMLSLIVRSIEIKAEVVRRDEREGGLRKILNFGHTLGHAIEAESGYRLLHGEAVAIGMVLEGRLAERIGVAARGTAEWIEEAVGRAGLPTSHPRELDSERILAMTRGDKKVRAGAAEYALPRRIGEMAGEESGWAMRVSDADVRAVLATA